MNFDWEPFFLTLQLAAATTGVLLLVGLPIAYWIGRTAFPGRSLVEAIVSLPLVLPPSVLGFYLLVAFSPGYSFGRFLEEHLNLRLVFSFSGLLVGSVLFSLPFMVHPIKSGLQSLSPHLWETSQMLGKPLWVSFWRVILPSIRAPLLVGTALSFAHTMGEFGVVLMIGGNVPGKTRVASIAIYDAVEALNYRAANFQALLLILVSLAILLFVYGRRRPGVIS